MAGVVVGEGRVVDEPVLAADAYEDQTVTRSGGGVVAARGHEIVCDRHRFVLPWGCCHRRARFGHRVRGLTFRGSSLEPQSEEHTSELQSLMRISYAVFCLKKKLSTHTH